MSKKKTLKKAKSPTQFGLDVEAGSKGFKASLGGKGDTNPINNPFAGTRRRNNSKAMNFIQDMYRDIKTNKRTKQALSNANYRNKRLSRQILAGGNAVAEASLPWADMLKEKYSAPYKYAPSSVTLYEGNLGKTEDEALPKSEEEKRWPR